MRAIRKTLTSWAPRLFSLLTVSLLLVAVMMPRIASATPVKLSIKVIYAHNKNNEIDPKLKKLAKDLSKLKFTGYELKDEISLPLEIGSTGRVQLPNHEWMSVSAKELSKDGKLRLQMHVEKLKFKTTVSIAAGATLAVGGPPFEEGALILAVSRPK